MLSGSDVRELSTGEETRSLPEITSQAETCRYGKEFFSYSRLEGLAPPAGTNLHNTTANQMCKKYPMLSQLANRFRTVSNRFQAAHLTIRLGSSNGYRLSMDIQAQKFHRFLHDRFRCSSLPAALFCFPLRLTA